MLARTIFVCEVSGERGVAARNYSLPSKLGPGFLTLAARFLEEAGVFDRDSDPVHRNFIAPSESLEALRLNTPSDGQSVRFMTARGSDTCS